MIWVRFFVCLVGAYLFLLGTGKAVWEVYSWAVLSQLGERPALVGDNPRVNFRLPLFVAAVGAAIVFLGAFAWR